MKPKTSKYHNWQEGDCGKPIKVGCYYKKGFWKRYDRKKYYRNLFKILWKRELENVVPNVLEL